MFYTVIFFCAVGLAYGFPKESPPKNVETDQRLFLYLNDQDLNNQIANEQSQKEEKFDTPSQQQQIYQPNGFGEVQYLDPQYQYSIYNQQSFPRVQPSILLYGAGGQGQPILINPGTPPGNFLVPQQPQQPGTVFFRGNPQNPVFVGGYPNPKPAHIPPIEKDAEEIPTNPSSIPPLPSSNPKERKPEKLETFNEEKPELQPKEASEAGVLAEADKNPSPVTRNNLKPENPNIAFQQVDQYQNPQNFNYNGQIQTVLLRNAPNLNEQHNFNDISIQNPGELNQQNPLQNGPRYTQSFVPLTPLNVHSLKENFPDLVQLSGQTNPHESLFRTNFQGNNEAERVAVGQFRFTPPNQAYFPFGDDPENDSVIVNANFDDTVNAGQELPTQQDISIPSTKSSDPSMAQATPGAIALAGPGGVAGASPRATALVGKGGLAVSSPKATAIAGTKEQKDEKETKTKESEKRPTRKPKK